MVASIAGLLGGLGFSKLLGGLFDAAGMGIPRGAMELAPRTIVIGLVVGIGVTMAAALLPAVRATRVPPVAAMREDVAPEPAGTSRRRLAAVAVVGFLGVALLVHGLFGSGAASSRLAAMGAGSLLVFVVVAMTARHAVRPLAALVGWPLERLGHTTGELARENSTRNPARTAITAAALMVGIALVAFVAVLADGMKTSFTGAIDQRASADLVVTSDNGMPLPGAARDRIQYLPEVSTATAQYLDQVKVNGQGVHALTDQVNGVDALALRDVYRFRWIRGSDIELQRLGPGAAIVEEQFAKQHRISVGRRFRLTGPTGHTATFTAIAEYRDPQLLQGVMVDLAQFRALSPARDPMAYFVRFLHGSDANAAKQHVQAALAPVPGRQGPHPGRVQPLAHETARPARLPALRAARHERRDLDVRDRQQPLPLDPRAHPRARHAARRRRHRRPGPAHDPLRERHHVAHRRRARHRRRRAVRVADHLRRQGPRRRVQRAGGATRRVPRAWPSWSVRSAPSRRRDAQRG